MEKLVYFAILILVYCPSMANIFGQSAGAPRIYEVEFVNGVDCAHLEVELSYELLG